VDVCEECAVPPGLEGVTAPADNSAIACLQCRSGEITDAASFFRLLNYGMRGGERR